MTVRELIIKAHEFDKKIEERRQKAAYAAKRLWNILEYPQVTDNQEEIRERWQEVANTLADLRDAVGEFNELMKKEVKD